MSSTTLVEKPSDSEKVARPILLGKPLSRVEGSLKVTGSAKYASEFEIENVAYGAIVQSTISKGRIARIETREAENAEGVIAVITHENAPKLNLSNGDIFRILEERKLVLQDNVIDNSGQHIGLVVADTLEHAMRASDLVSVSYEEERPDLDTLANISRAYKPDNFSGIAKARVSWGSYDEARQKITPSQRFLEQTYTTPIEHHNAMEPHSVIASWEDYDRLTVYDSTQGVVQTKTGLSKIFGIPPENVRVISYFIGGGFGSKGPMWQHVLLAAIGSRIVHRPVKIMLRRSQMFTSTGHRPETIQRVSIVSEENGNLVALKHHTITQTSITGEFFEPSGLATPSMYKCPNLEVMHEVVRLNIASPDYMRAPGEASGSFALESALDELSYLLGIDPVKLRMINYAYEDPQEKKPWSSKHLRECYELGMQRFGWSSRNPKPRSMRDGKNLVGVGMATAMYPGFRRPTSAKVRMLDDGRVIVSSATQDIGTGTYTIVSQIAAEIVGVPISDVVADIGDSSLPPAGLSGGSTTAASVGTAVKEASTKLLEKLHDLARNDSSSPLYRIPSDQVVAMNGELVSADGKSHDPFDNLLERNRLSSIEGEAKSEPGEESKKFSIHSFGAQFAEVKIDPDLGEIKVTRLFGVFDIGQVINLKTARSQLMGGMVWGLGMALLEKTVYEETHGRVVTNNLADYLVPVNADVPEIDVQFVGGPDPQISSLGARGAGEIGITGAAAAIANAVYHATGKRIRNLPITREDLLA